MPKRLLSGVVVSSNSNKTIIVKVTRRVKHKLYRKIISRSKKYHAHDENNQFKVGDNVSIIESKPISKLKNWVVVSDNGGIIHVKGNARNYMGFLMRRGLIYIGGSAGDFCCSKMIAGTVIVSKKVGRSFAQQL